jgi:hypothetical protein
MYERDSTDPQTGGYDYRAPTRGSAPPPQPAYYPPAPVKRRRTTPLWVTITVGGAGIVIGAAVGSGGSKNTPAASSSPVTVTITAPTSGAAPAPAAAKTAPVDKGTMADVTLGKPTFDSFGSVTVPVAVTNHSSKTSNYIIEFEVDNAAGIKVGDGLAATNNLTPGQKAQLSGAAMGSGDGGTSVKLTNVTRYASS